MHGYKTNIEDKTLKNKAYRKVLYTTEQSQLVIMSIPYNDDIDFEIHRKTTQFIRIERGECDVYINNKKYKLKDGDVAIIPAGCRHYVKNTGNEDLKLYTIYSPPEHEEDLIQMTHPLRSSGSRIGPRSTRRNL